MRSFKVYILNCNIRQLQNKQNKKHIKRQNDRKTHKTEYLQPEINTVQQQGQMASHSHIKQLESCERDEEVNQIDKQNENKFKQKQAEKQTIPQSTNYKEMLAERPSNGNFASSKNQNSINQSSKTALNFHVSKKKTEKIAKSKSSQKIIQTKSNQQNGQTPNNQVDDVTVMTLIFKVIQRMRARGDDMTLECLLNEEKLINITLALLEKKVIKSHQVEQIFSLEKEIVSFIQKINKVTMENFKQQDESVDIKIFSKAVNILMTPHMNRYVKDLKTLGKIKVLTFNNLACIYKKKKKFGIALRSVSFALQIQDSLLNEQSNEEKYDIIPTYLNKAAILSEMGKHEKAIEEIMKSQKFIEKIERQVIKQIREAQLQNNIELKKRLQEKRYYGLYMKMIINYNMGAQKQHMKMMDPACEYYKQGRQLAIMINNQFMVKKFEGILNKIMDGRKK